MMRFYIWRQDESSSSVVRKVEKLIRIRVNDIISVQGVYRETEK